MKNIIAFAFNTILEFQDINDNSHELDIDVVSVRHILETADTAVYSFITKAEYRGANVLPLLNSSILNPDILFDSELMVEVHNTVRIIRHLREDQWEKVTKQKIKPIKLYIDSIPKTVRCTIPKFDDVSLNYLVYSFSTIENDENPIYFHAIENIEYGGKSIIEIADVFEYDMARKIFDYAIDIPNDTEMFIGRIASNGSYERPAILDSHQSELVVHKDNYTGYNAFEALMACYLKTILLDGEKEASSKMSHSNTVVNHADII